jgi:hypothetical protein
MPETPVGAILFILVLGIFFFLISLGLITHTLWIDFNATKTKDKLIFFCMGILLCGFSINWFFQNSDFFGLYPTATLGRSTESFGEKVPLDIWEIKTQNQITITPQIEKIKINGKQTTALKAEKLILESKGVSSPDLVERWTETIQWVNFTWKHPITNKPYSGIISRLYVEPEKGYEDDKIFCAYFLVTDMPYNVETFESSVVYVPNQQWTTLVWDFTGHVWAGGHSWTNDWNELAGKISTEGYSFTNISRRMSEKTLYEAVQHKVDWKDTTKSMGIRCFVTANSAYTSDASPVFQGDITLADVWVLPVNYPGLP